jgi:formylglycine-generating enzyme required for sulfatase activity
MNKLEGWGAVLWRKWEKGNQGDTIQGFWVEDGSEFKIIIPYQLRDMIIEIQNWLSDFYIEVENLQSRINNIKHIFD